MIAALFREFSRAVLRLRYSIEVFGVQDVAAKGTRGILFLPNHPALMDPVIVMSELHRHFQPRSLADKDQVEPPRRELPGPEDGSPDAAGRGQVRRGLPARGGARPGRVHRGPEGGREPAPLSRRPPHARPLRRPGRDQRRGDHPGAGAGRAGRAHPHPGHLGQQLQLGPGRPPAPHVRAPARGGLPARQLPLLRAPAQGLRGAARARRPAPHPGPGGPEPLHGGLLQRRRHPQHLRTPHLLGRRRDPDPARAGAAPHRGRSQRSARRHPGAGAGAAAGADGSRGRP